MLIPEKGGAPDLRTILFHTVFPGPGNCFYYPTRCGHYFCSSEYSFSHQSEIARQGDHNQNIMLFLLSPAPWSWN